MAIIKEMANFLDYNSNNLTYLKRSFSQIGTA